MDWTESIIRARYLVASLGESAAPPWWRTQATSATGQRFLARLYPRTFLQASLETASRAARIEHDERIGRIGVYHLFRLPSAEEAALYDALRTPAAATILADVSALPGPEKRLAALAALAGGERVRGAPGPLACGTVESLRKGAGLRRVCAAYAAAFQTNARTYPYVEDQAS